MAAVKAAMERREAKGESHELFQDLVVVVVKKDVFGRDTQVQEQNTPRSKQVLDRIQIIYARARPSFLRYHVNGGARESALGRSESCLLYTSPSPRDRQKSRMPSSA